MLCDHPEVFAFERDFAESLQCIPMIVRMKLDLVGIKLTLRQWNRLPKEVRGHMVEVACGSGCEIAAFRADLLRDIAQFTDEPPRLIAPASGLEWSGTTVPLLVCDLARIYAMPVVTPGRWSALTGLQRFALIKLARSENEHRNFCPAMIEFGLCEAIA